MKKKILMLMFIAALTTGASGCTYEAEAINEDTEVDMLQNNEVQIPSLSQALDVQGEDFKLVCDYDIGNYSLENWHVTDAKSIGMKVHTEGLPDGYDVVIDHVHADISLMSTSPQINGITQDSMDDTFHGQNQDGFAISNDMEYYNIFSIEGYTDQFYQLWGYAFGDYGSMSSSYKRLTELNIIKAGTYAERLSIVYDVSIKKPGSDKYYTKSVKSMLAIPISTNVKTVERDFWTDQIVNNSEE